jgi:hypothetical protein
MTCDDRPEPRRSEVENNPALAEQKVDENATVATPRAKRAETRMSAEEALNRWGYVVESLSWRPHVAPADPAAPGECLCGQPADFVVETNWFGGRRSRDPVCGHHVDEVVGAIRKAQARRDGA